MGNKDNRKSFLIYYDNEVIVYRLPDDEAGKLFKSLFPYARESIKPDFEDSPALAMAFDILSLTIDRDREKYDERCKKNRENVSKRWNKNNTTVYDRNQSHTKDTYIDKDRDKDIDKDRDRDINYQLIVDMYNNTCVSFPKIIKLSEKRKKAIRARLRIYSIDDFQKLFEIAESSSFLKGQNSRNWSATFDWMITDGNMAKVLDGNYTDRSRRSQGMTAEQKARQEENEQFYRELHEQYKWDPSPDDPFQ